MCRLELNELRISLLRTGAGGMTPIPIFFAAAATAAAEVTPAGGDDLTTCCWPTMAPAATDDDGGGDLNMVWLLLSSEFKERSVSLLTSCEVVCPTTPLEKSGGISMLSEDPTLEELSLRARLDPASSSSSSPSSSSSSWERFSW